jgi:hypothetical protein
MTANFHEVMSRRNELLHKLAIWQEIADHLVKFLDTDSFPAVVGIRSEGGGMVAPQESIEAVLNTVKSSYVGEIQEELKKINKREVAEYVEQRKQSSSKKKGKETKKGTKGKRAFKIPSTRSK